MDAKHYEENKLEQQERNRKNNRKYKLKFAELKSKITCIRCEEADECCLDFHHVDDNKEGNLARLILVSQKKAIEEAEKCIIICATCHRKLHAGRFKLNEDKIKEQKDKIKNLLV